MSKKSIPGHTLGPRALEMVMRDVLGGIEEFALMKNDKTSDSVFEVVSIDPLEEKKEAQNKSGQVATPSKENQSGKADIIQIEKFRTQTNDKK